MEQSPTMPPATEQSSATNGTSSSSGDDATTTRAHQMTLPLPLRYAELPVSSKEATNTGMPLDPDTYKGSSPRKYKLSQSGSGIGVATLPPMMLAVPAWQASTAATGRSPESKQTSSGPSAPRSATHALGLAIQLSQNIDASTQPTLLLEPATMSEFNKYGYPQAHQYPLSPGSDTQDGLPPTGLATRADRFEAIDSVYLARRIHQHTDPFHQQTVAHDGLEQHIYEFYHTQEEINGSTNLRLDELERQSRILHQIVMGQPQPGPQTNIPRRLPPTTEASNDPFVTDSPTASAAQAVESQKSMAVPLLSKPSKTMASDNRTNKFKVPPRLNIGTAAHTTTGSTESGMPTPATAILPKGPLTSMSDKFSGALSFDAAPETTNTPDSTATSSSETPSTPTPIPDVIVTGATLGRIGPPVTGKATAGNSKRGIHDLKKSIPPAHVVIPLLPLTDVEIIVYFYNTLSRPIVTLRLYGRKWGPAAIVKVLNEHREIHPPYLRNTCSVKCTTALKSAKETHGLAWMENNKAVFLGCNDFKATDMMRHTNGESTVDYELSSLCLNLKKHPGVGEGGIFTRCVKYCQETGATFTIGNVQELAVALLAGETPMAPSESPSAPNTPVYLHQGTKRKHDGNDTEDTGDSKVIRIGDPSSDETGGDLDATGDGDESAASGEDDSSTESDASDDSDDSDESGSEHDTDNDNDEEDEEDEECSTPTPVKKRGADDLAAAYSDL